MLITKIIERDMGHRLLDHRSKCANVHGHRYKAEISLEWDITYQPWESSNGMIVDFSDIKNIAKDFIDNTLDHSYMFQDWDMVWKLIAEEWLKCIQVEFPPTAENIAIYLYEKLQTLYEQKFGERVRLYAIKLWETPNGYVTYQP